MRDVVGERAFEVAQAACNLYHGVLYAGRQRGVPASQSLRELREGAFALADEAIEARRARDARRQAGTAAAGAGGAATPAGRAGEQLGQGQQQGGGSQPRSLKRERCGSQQQGQGQQAWSREEENAPQNGAAAEAEREAAVLSPSQQQQERRRRLSGELWLAAGWAVQPAAAAAGGEGQEGAEEGDAEAGMAALSLCCSPVGILRAGEPPEAGAVQALEEEEEAQQRLQPKQGADLSSLRARLQAALGAASSTGG